MLFDMSSLLYSAWYNSITFVCLCKCTSSHLHLFCWNSSNTTPSISSPLSFLLPLAPLPSTWRSLCCFLGQVFTREPSANGCINTPQRGGPGKQRDTQASQHLVSVPAAGQHNLNAWASLANCPLSVYVSDSFKGIRSPDAEQTLRSRSVQIYKGPLPRNLSVAGLFEVSVNNWDMKENINITLNKDTEHHN